MAYIAGIEASKQIVKNWHDDTQTAMDHLEYLITIETDDNDAYRMTERLDLLKHDERIYDNLIKELDALIEAEINAMAEAYSA